MEHQKRSPNDKINDTAATKLPCSPDAAMCNDNYLKVRKITETTAPVHHSTKYIKHDYLYKVIIEKYQDPRVPVTACFYRL